MKFEYRNGLLYLPICVCYDKLIELIGIIDTGSAGLLRASSNQTKVKELNGRYQIGHVLQAYISEKQASNAWKEKTEGSLKAVFKIFAEVMAGKHFDAIGYEEMRHYKEIILKLPKNLNCEKRFSGKAITEIIEMDDLDLSSNKTRNKHLGTMSTLFEWAMRHGYTDKNYAKGLTVAESNTASHQEIPNI